MPSKNLSDDVTQLYNHISLISSKSACVDFSFVETDYALRVEAHAPGVFRLRVLAVDKLNNEKLSTRAKVHQEMLLAREEAVSEMELATLPDDVGWSLAQGETTLLLYRSPFKAVLQRNEQVIWQSQPNVLTRLDDSAWQWTTLLHEDDALYGLGDTQQELDRRGESLASTGLARLPLLWSTRGWGLYVNTFSPVTHDLGHQHAELYVAQVHDAKLDLFLFFGEPSEIINQYSALTGRAGQSGLAPMGLWLEAQAHQNAEQINAVVAELEEQGVCLDVLDLGVRDAYVFQADKPLLEWDAERLAHPKAFAERRFELQLAAAGRPIVLADTALFEEWEDRAWLLINDEDGCAYQHPGDEYTQGRPFGLLDLTHKDVMRMWTERQRQMFDEGVAYAYCDANFQIADEVTGRGGETGDLLRAIYPILARQALFEAYAGHKTPQEGLVISSNLFPSAQRFAWQQGPRVENTWDGLERSLKSALAVGNSGVPVQVHRLGNALADTSTMTAELYLRWLASAVFSANFAFQSAPGLLPSAFDADTRALINHWLQWRFRLVPYVLGIIEDAVRTGLSVQRSMAQAFPHDEQARLWDTQYLLGPALLVAPVLHSGIQTKVYLPAGEAWWDMRTGWRYEGGTVLDVEVGLDSIPVFGREGHMLCLGPQAQHISEFNSARLLDEVWMFGMPEHNPVVMRNKIRVMQMQGSSYIKGLEGLKILPSEGLEVKRRGAEVRISRAR